MSPLAATYNGSKGFQPVILSSRYSQDDCATQMQKAQIERSGGPSRSSLPKTASGSALGSEFRIRLRRAFRYEFLRCKTRNESE